MKFIISLFLFFSLSSFAVIELHPHSDGIQYVDTEKKIYVKKYNNGTYSAYRPYMSPTGNQLIHVYEKKESEDLFINFQSRCPNKGEISIPDYK